MKEFYTVKEVSEILGVSRQTLLSWSKNGTLVPIKIGRVVRYPADIIKKLSI